MGIKSKASILIIDNNQEKRLILKQSLKKLGLKNIKEAADGKSAWELIDHEEFEIIFCELQLDNKNGLEVLAGLREKPNLKDTPFVLMMSDSRRELILKATKLGVTAVLVRPFSQESLTEILVKIFN